MYKENLRYFPGKFSNICIIVLHKLVLELKDKETSVWGWSRLQRVGKLEFKLEDTGVARGGKGLHGAYSL